jgi:hypothetical protein
MFSLRPASGGADEVQRDLLYLKELERQARLANWSIGKATEQAAAGEEDAAWAHLQGGMFAAIVVQRLLWPGRSTPTRICSTAARRHGARPDGLRVQHSSAWWAGAVDRCRRRVRPGGLG